MLKSRVIATLLLKGPGLVKGKGFNSWRRVGPALPAVRVFETRQIDELVLLDIAATPEGRGPDLDAIADVAGECFMPLTVGGGVRSLDDIRALLNAGADKVVIGTAAFRQDELVRSAAQKFGSQCITVAIDVRNIDGSHHVYKACGIEPVHVDPVMAACLFEASGAGEILLTSIDRDGTMEGYDLPLIYDVCEGVSVPVIASGGAGDYGHFLAAFHAGADAVAAGAMFQFTEATPRGAARYLIEHGVPVRV